MSIEIVIIPVTTKDLLHEARMNGLHDGWSVCMSWLFSITDYMIDQGIAVQAEFTALALAWPRSTGCEDFPIADYRLDNDKWSGIQLEQRHDLINWILKHTKKVSK